MTLKQKFLIEENDSNKRLDVFLAENLAVTRSQVQKLIEKKLVLVNEKLPKKAGDRLRGGYKVVINPPEKIKSGINKKSKIKEPKYKIKIAGETEDYLVLEKPAGMLVHPTEAQETNTLTDWLLKKYPDIKKVGDSEVRPGIVHRLDREASGLLVVAKNQKMFKHLKKQFQDREVEKEYFVLVYGQIEADHDVIDFEIDRGKEGKMASRPKIDKLKLKNVNKIQPGKEAVTEFWIEKRMARFTLLRVRIHTGRTHQIRVHMVAYNHPVVGDGLYFNPNLFKKGDKELNRLFLHSTKLCFFDLKKERKCFEVGLPVELKDYLKNLK